MLFVDAQAKQHVLFVDVQAVSISGVLGAAVAAGIWPFFAVVFSEITAVILLQETDKVRAFEMLGYTVGHSMS